LFFAVTCPAKPRGQVQLKKLQPISKEQVRDAFGNSEAEVYTDSKTLLNDLLLINWKNKNLLMMSSRNFEGIDITDLGKKIVQ
jgi:UDP-N-acetylmuramate: L-alanyl-gamma-D-glutamyl-meso-diaminopimelate ligase